MQIHVRKTLLFPYEFGKGYEAFYLIRLSCFAELQTGTNASLNIGQITYASKLDINIDEPQGTDIQSIFHQDTKFESHRANQRHSCDTDFLIS